MAANSRPAALTVHMRFPLRLVQRPARSPRAILILLVLLAYGLPVSAQAVPSVTTIGSFFSEALQKHPGPVYVAPFFGPGKVASELGVWASNTLAERLSVELNATLVESARAESAREKLLLAPETLAAHGGIAAYIGKQAGAAVVFVGNVELQGDEIIIETAAVETNRFTTISSATLRFRREAIHSTLAQKLVADSIEKANMSVISSAECDVCPPPKRSGNGFERRKSGTVMLRVLIGTDGKPKQIKFMRSLEAGHDIDAVQTVSQWKFKPNRNGRVPIEAWTIVELVFRLH